MSTEVIAHDLGDKKRTEDVILKENVTFDSLLLSEKTLKGLNKAGFRKPSPIQLKSIPLGRCGFDLIVKSKSGTGKTLVFSVIALEMINTSINETQVLILAPTREIAVQIEDVIKKIGAFFENLQIKSFIGGLPLDDDIKNAKNCHIAVGTPGRIKQLIINNHLKSNYINLFILDEADKLMECSFQPDINAIFRELSKTKQIITTSATYPSQLETFLSNYMLSPTQISADSDSPLLLGLKQFVSILNAHPNVVQQLKIKNENLLEILSKISFTQCLIFCNFQTRAQSLSNLLNQKGWDSSFISAAQPQLKRLKAVKDLKDFKFRILLSTDLTARGIDASNVDLVINYDVPTDPMTYLHRMGRAGRFGSLGICVTLASDGAELTHLKNVLGAIGGENISIFKLPNFEMKNLDLLNLNTDSLEQISGTIPKNPETYKIKNEILKLKEIDFTDNPLEINEKNGNKNKKNSCDEKKIALKNDNNSSEVLDSKKLFESLASGNYNFIDESYESDDSSKNQLPIETVQNLVDCGKKRKQCERTSPVDSINKELHKEKQSADNLTILHKNKALLSAAKLLFDPSTKIQSDIADSIATYQNDLREIDDFPDENQSNMIDKNNKNLENIFEIAYDFAIDSNKKNWLNYFPEEEIKKFEKFCLTEESNDDSDDEEGEEDYDGDDNEDFESEMNENFDICEQAENSLNEDVAMKWVPIDSNNDSSQIVDNNKYLTSNDHFRGCFQKCSANLWQNGLSFGNVANFDAWFYQWQCHLTSVREYVQQNIYVKEMSKFQEEQLRK